MLNDRTGNESYSKVADVATERVDIELLFEREIWAGVIGVGRNYKQTCKYKVQHTVIEN